MNPKDLVGAKKAPLRYVPHALVIGVSEAMFIGQDKYGPFNWREQPVSAMTYAEAIQRHLAAWVDGQDLAEDTSVHHLKHIGASIAILLDALGIKGGLLDDRPLPGPAADLLRDLDKSEPPFKPEDQWLAGERVISVAEAMKLTGLDPDMEDLSAIRVEVVPGDQSEADILARALGIGNLHPQGSTWDEAGVKPLTEFIEEVGRARRAMAAAQEGVRDTSGPPEFKSRPSLCICPLERMLRDDHLVTCSLYGT